MNLTPKYLRDVTHCRGRFGLAISLASESRGRIEDLLQFTFNPENVANFSKIPRATCSESLGSLRNRSISSAYSARDSYIVPTLMACISPDDQSATASGSMASANRNGDSGHSCLVPHI